MGHTIKENAPQKFEELRQLIRREFYTAASWENAVEMRRKQYADALGREISREYAEEEVVCNSLGRLLGNERVMEKLARENKNLFAKIWRAVKAFFEKLFGGMTKDYSAKTPEQVLVENGTGKAQRKLEDAFVKALRTSSKASGAIAELTVTDEAKPAEKAEKSTVTSTKEENVQVSGEKNKRYLLSEANVNDNLLNLIGKIENRNYKDNDKVELKKTTPEVAQIIQELTGVNVRDFAVVIESRQLVHIIKDHGKNGKTDQSLADAKDIARMELALDHPDSITKSGRTHAYTFRLNGRDRTAPTVLYEKYIGPKSYYIVQAVPDTKKKTLYIVSAFIGNPGYKKGTSQLIDASKSPNATSKNGFVVVPNNSIPDSAEKSNPSDEKSSEKITEGVEEERYSLSDNEQREKLASAFYGLAQTEAEREIVLEYKREIENTGKRIARRAELIRRLEELEGKRGFGGERSSLRAAIKELTEKIEGSDTKLFELEAAQPFRDVMQKYRRTVPGAANERTGIVTMSQGQYNAAVARIKNEKVYSRKDAEKIADLIKTTKRN